MKKVILEIYALAVCFTAVICFVIAAGFGFYSLAGVLNPEFTLDSWQYKRHRSNENFWSNNLPPLPFEDKVDKRVRPPEQELAELRAKSYQQAIEAEQRSRMQILVRVIIILFIDIMVFLVHWRIAKKARIEKDS